jgi:hypothetical protein
VWLAAKSRALFQQRRVRNLKGRYPKSNPDVLVFTNAVTVERRSGIWREVVFGEATLR